MTNVDIKHFVLGPDKKHNKGRVRIEDLDVTSEHRVRTMGKYGVYLKFHNKGIDRYTAVYRYIKAENLIRAIREGRIFVHNIQQFDDVREMKGLQELRQ